MMHYVVGGLALVGILKKSKKSQRGWSPSPRRGRVGAVLKEENGVTVSVNPISGSELGELVASGTFNAKPKAVADLLWDIAAYPGWVPRVKKTENVTKTNTVRTDYFVFAAPSGGDRDIVSETKRVDKADKITLQFQPKDGVGPAPAPGVTRLSQREGGWTLTATSDGKTQATYRLRADPGVKMPTRMLQKLAAGGIIDLFAAIQKKLV